LAAKVGALLLQLYISGDKDRNRERTCVCCGKNGMLKYFYYLAHGDEEPVIHHVRSILKIMIVSLQEMKIACVNVLNGSFKTIFAPKEM
jgi:hypothetical protein